MICSICKSPILQDESVKRCESCNYEFHFECWTENIGCGTPGCVNLPKTAGLETEVINDTSPWETEKKICPVCAELIAINSYQCPYCKEIFITTSPLTTDDIKNRYKPNQEPDFPEKKWAIVIFICGLLGITAPLNLIFGGIWFNSNKKILHTKSPALYFLAMIGLIFSIIYLFLFIIGLLLS